MDETHRARILAYIACSLDGYIAAPDGGVSWLNQYASTDSGVADFMRSVGVIAMGRTTYDHSRKLGPPPKTEARTVVLTHRPLPDDAPNDADTLQGDATQVATTLRELAAPTGRDVWLMGGGRVIADFLDAEEVDVLDVFVMPILLGAGLPLFPLRKPRESALKLQIAKPYVNGVVQLTYTPIR